MSNSLTSSKVYPYANPLPVNTLPVNTLNTQWVAGVQQGVERIKAESRIEYIPFERSVMEYEEVRRQVQVPVTKRLTDYYAVQTDVEYIPQIYQEKVIQYQPVERVREIIDYQVVQTQNVLGVVRPFH